MSSGLHMWRVTTALRTFMLALATGMVVNDGNLVESAPALVGLMLAAATCATLEWTLRDRRTMWIPLAEGAVSATLLVLSQGSPGLLVYLAVPPMIAGVRHGWVTTLNTTVLAGVVLAGFGLRPDDPGSAVLAASAPWLLLGLAAGLLASWQSRSVRHLEARQAPYTAAHQLMMELHRLARSGAVGLDSSVVASELAAAVRSELGALCSLVVVTESSVPLDAVGPPTERARLAEAVQAYRSDHELDPDIRVLPLRGSTGIFGWVALAGPEVHHLEPAQAQHRADEFALQLDTAMIFDRVRVLATAEERHRIAREIHDGVAQEIVALGYVVDEIASVSHEPEVEQLALALRSEITRVVTELRLSIFDLRNDVDHLPSALAEHVRGVSHDAGLRPHLLLDESGPALSPRAQTELLRIAQEAIANVRRHAGARNLWVTLVTKGEDVLLEIEDDGVGNAAVKDRHWGLQTMRERADAISADLTVRPRPGGGTSVRIQSRPVPTPEGSSTREHHSPARR